MDITINLNPLIEWFFSPTDVMLETMMLKVGWIPIFIILFQGFIEIWKMNRQDKWGSTIKFVLLAIDIPRNNEQTPRAAENMFSYLGGAHMTFNLIEEYIEGRFQLSFSYEIVSINGYTQFLIRTPEMYRGLIETSVYSQYPDAEITEVEDYTKDIPKKFPNDQYDVWGAEIIQSKSAAFPIKTYGEFEHKAGPSETQYKDPMAALMDLCGSLNENEQLWYQLIVRPIGFDQMPSGEDEIKKIMKEEVAVAKSFSDVIFGGIISFLEEVVYTILGVFNVVKAPVKEEKKEALKMVDLRPIQKKMMEAIEKKTGKMMFSVKIRFIHVAKKGFVNKAKVVGGFVGFIKQFADVHLNNLRPETKMTGTSVKYPPFKDRRLNEKKTKIVSNYAGRSWWSGGKAGFYNVEELATLWSFPNSSVVRAPSLQKVLGKKSQPPASLPSALAESYVEKKDDFTLELVEKDDKMEVSQKQENKKEEIIGLRDTPPSNLPVI